MRPLKLLPGQNPVIEFNDVLDGAYNRAKASGKVKDEPNFVRELISKKTIIELNTAAANSYDENVNSVRFSGGFIHGHPQAKFDAVNGPTTTPCLRELADALVILNETAPNNMGIHEVIRRSACLLMFKTKSAANPRSLRYDASKLPPPKGTDQQQFHLFNAWPKFDLNCDGKVTGPYSISQPTTAADRHNHGKFGVLWSPTTKKICTWGHKWRYSDPLPALPVSDSLGLLLTRMADSDSRSGREYELGGFTDWDKLIVDLQTYADTHNWGGGVSRSANPSNLSFMQARDIVDTSLGTISQHIRTAFMQSWQVPGRHSIIHLRHHFDFWEFHARRNYHEERIPDGALPILNITVSSFRPLEQTESMDQRSRLLTIDQAEQRLFDLLRRQ